jgi:hypothetical protein
VCHLLHFQAEKVATKNNSKNNDKNNYDHGGTFVGSAVYATFVFLQSKLCLLSRGQWKTRKEKRREKEKKKH